ncbi:cytochrome P450 4c21-like isoform X2 [Leptopilina heterotoma]|uniref:cytochrome P450 4c21-like isoform X2 n=1 Tax=Leptopilina heterotoma TaxID=63436 RepID=UPI001CA9DFA8|nr:cytochrome P450 4c21-like isoform X2 [Leptopilina heterotoma]
MINDANIFIIKTIKRLLKEIGAVIFVGNQDMISVMGQLSYSYPSICRLWLGNKLIVNIYDPELLKIFLYESNALEKSRIYKVFEPLLGKSLFTASVPSWHAHRKIILPAFSTKRLHQYIEIINKNLVNFMDLLSSKENCEEFDITKIYKINLLRSVLEIFMDNQLNMCDDEITKFAELTSRSINLMKKRIYNIFLLPDFLFNLTQLSRETYTNAASVKDILNTIIQRRRTFLKTTDDKDENCNKTLLDTLIEQCDHTNAITDEEVLQEITTIIFGSIDTTIATFSFLILVLVTHPEIQTRVHEELYRIFGHTDPNDYPANDSDLIKMEYLSRVIKETLRYFPTVPYFLRNVTNDLRIKKYTIPKGTDVFISIAQLHKNKKFWPKPKNFDPDRFLPNEIAKRPSCCYLPFSMGSRSCIGFRFAEMLLKIVISSILRKYVLSCDKTIPLQHVKLDYRIFAHQREPIKIKIKKIETN